MAAAIYTTDLATVNILDTDATPAVGEPTGSVAGTTIGIETDHFVVGTASINKIFNATGIGGLGFQNATAVTVPTDGAVYMWTYFGAPGAIADKTAGGMQILIGNTLANYKRYYIYGKDTVPYGGWQCFAVDPAQLASATQGTPSGTWQYFGMAANVLSAVARGYPLVWDAVRSGRGSINITNGDLANGYANFSSCATENDTNTTVGPKYNRWGILSFGNGTYTLQGRLSLGTAATPVDFRDSNRAIFIKNTEYVTANFNLFEIINAASRVDWTGISISALGTVAKGNVLLTNNATFNVDSCTFTDMGTFTLQSNTTITNSIFRRCGLVTHGNALITGCLFTNSTTTAIITATPGNIQNCEFVSDGTGHAIQLTTPGTYTFSGNIFSNYGATGTTNAVIYNNSGGAITLNVSGGGSVPTFLNGTSATTTIVAAANVTLTGLKADSEIRAYLGTNPATATELAAVESSGTSYTFSQSAGGQSGYIQIFHVNYQPVYLEVVYSGADTSIPIQQITDRQYSRGSVFTPG